MLLVSPAPAVFNLFGIRFTGIIRIYLLGIQIIVGDLVVTMTSLFLVSARLSVASRHALLSLSGGLVLFLR